MSWLTPSATVKEERTTALLSASGNPRRLGVTVAGGDADGGERRSKSIHHQDLFLF
jgi:hypothetical protein